jgi:hypothetical protein
MDLARAFLKLQKSPQREGPSARAGSISRRAASPPGNRASLRSPGRDGPEVSAALSRHATPAQPRYFSRATVDAAERVLKIESATDGEGPNAQTLVHRVRRTDASGWGIGRKRAGGIWLRCKILLPDGEDADLDQVKTGDGVALQAISGRAKPRGPRGLRRCRMRGDEGKDRAVEPAQPGTATGLPAQHPLGAALRPGRVPQKQRADERRRGGERQEPYLRVARVPVEVRPLAARLHFTIAAAVLMNADFVAVVVGIQQSDVEMLSRREGMGRRLCDGR